jgi:hypothetical protein
VLEDNLVLDNKKSPDNQDAYKDPYNMQKWVFLYSIQAFPVNTLPSSLLKLSFWGKESNVSIITLRAPMP